MNENKKSNYGISGVIFVGCMFLGMSLGYLLDEQKTGIFIGMGVGFIAMGLVSLLNRDKLVIGYGLS